MCTSHLAVPSRLVTVTHKTAYEIRIRDWSSDVCAADLEHDPRPGVGRVQRLDVLVRQSLRLRRLLNRRRGRDSHHLEAATLGRLQRVDHNLDGRAVGLRATPGLLETGRVAVGVATALVLATDRVPDHLCVAPDFLPWLLSFC